MVLSTVLHVRNPLTLGTTRGREEMAASSEPWTGMTHSYTVAILWPGLGCLILGLIQSKMDF